MVSSSVEAPALRPFMRKRPHDRADGLSTNCTGTAVTPQGKAREGSGLFVAPGRMASGSLHSEMALCGTGRRRQTLLFQNLNWLRRKNTQAHSICSVEIGLKVSSPSPSMAEASPRNTHTAQSV
jgi:hypothetical protein